MNREYETHEVLKLIGENPTWKFQTIFSDGVIWEAFSRMDNKGVRCIYGKGTNSEDEDFLSSDSTTMNRKWERVKESVDFMTALNSGRRVRVEHPLTRDTSSYTSVKGVLSFLSMYFGHHDLKDIIVNGEWYIED